MGSLVKESLLTKLASQVNLTSQGHGRCRDDWQLSGPRELAAFGLAETSRLTFALYLSDDGGVNGRGGRVTAGRPIALGNHLFDDGLAAKRFTGFGQDLGSRG